ncbi:MAG: hypothetical protein IJC64_04640 [Clostridia bacterium]|nr:hypothetical protein [Clostridia bacterium]
MIFWILLLVGSIIAFLVLEMFIFPSLFLKSNYSIGKTADRGIRKYKTSANGLYMIYEPNWIVRKFIKQYIIAAEEDRKIMKCMVEYGVDYVEYDAVLFDTTDKVFRVLNVQQLIGDSIYTDEIELPRETAYATLILRRVNNRVFPQTASSRISPRRLLIYGLFTCLAALGASVSINISLANMFGGVFRESYVANMGTWITATGVALAAAAVCALVLSLIIASRDFKKKKK